MMEEDRREADEAEADSDEAESDVSAVEAATEEAETHEAASSVGTMPPASSSPCVLVSLGSRKQPAPADSERGP